jgi:hypothetical protein
MGTISYLHVEQKQIRAVGSNPDLYFQTVFGRSVVVRFNVHALNSSEMSLTHSKRHLSPTDFFTGFTRSFIYAIRYKLC